MDSTAVLASRKGTPSAGMPLTSLSKRARRAAFGEEGAKLETEDALAVGPEAGRDPGAVEHAELLGRSAVDHLGARPEGSRRRQREGERRILEPPQQMINAPSSNGNPARAGIPEAAGEMGAEPRRERRRGAKARCPEVLFSWRTLSGASRSGASRLFGRGAGPRPNSV